MLRGRRAKTCARFGNDRSQPPSRHPDRASQRADRLCAATPEVQSCRGGEDPGIHDRRAPQSRRLAQVLTGLGGLVALERVECGTDVGRSPALAQDGRVEGRVGVRERLLGGVIEGEPRLAPPPLSCASLARVEPPHSVLLVEEADRLPGADAEPHLVIDYREAVAERAPDGLVRRFANEDRRHADHVAVDHGPDEFPARDNARSEGRPSPREHRSVLVDRPEGPEDEAALGMVVEEPHAPLEKSRLPDVVVMQDRDVPRARGPDELGVVRREADVLSADEVGHPVVREVRLDNRGELGIARPVLRNGQPPVSERLRHYRVERLTEKRVCSARGHADIDDGFEGSHPSHSLHAATAVTSQWIVLRPFHTGYDRRVRVLVTGHEGYIGSVAVPMLQAAGHDVVGLDTAYYAGCDLYDPAL